MDSQRSTAMRVASSTNRKWNREKEVQEDDLGMSHEWEVIEPGAVGLLEERGNEERIFPTLPMERPGSC